MKIAIVTMAYNEKVNLPIWIRYYRRAAPNAALFVIDHSSDDGSTAQIPEVNKLCLPREEFDEWTRVGFVSHLQRALLQYYELVIYTDCDELIVADPAKAQCLEAHLATQTYEYASPVGLSVLHVLDVEKPINLTEPLLGQRRFCQFHATMCKPLIARVPLKWEPGFHACDKPLRVDRNLYLFHTKAIDRDLAVHRLHITQKIPWSQQAIKANHGRHHRYDDERFVREFFLDRQNQLLKQGAARPFEFDVEIARMQEEAFESTGFFHVKQFSGPVVAIPER